MDESQQSEYDAQYEAAKAYRPDFEGPLISAEVPLMGLAQSYEEERKAKLEKLSIRFPSYRQIRPDGNCGWTAILFQYLSFLLQDVLRSGANGLDRERQRLQSQVKTLQSLPLAASDPEMIEDFVQPLLGMLDLIRTWQGLSAAEAADKLMQEVETNKDYMIYHLRILASAHLRANSELFQNYLPDMPIETFCAEEVEIPQRDIDQLSLVALHEAHVGPAGMGLEVYSLDQSTRQSEVALVHELAPPPSESRQESGNESAKVIRLLLRTNHYDLLGHPITAQGAGGSGEEEKT